MATYGWEKNNMEYGLIGEKLGHSYSKLIQEKLLDNYTYELYPIPKEDLDSFLKEKNFKAINVTIPYKRDVIPYLNELDDAAKKIGAVNTIVNRNGYLIGKNTDYGGFAYLLKKHQIQVNGKKVLVMGNGGASQAIQAVLHDQGIKEMVIVDIIASEKTTTLEDVYQNHKDVEVIVNTTPLGMYPNVDASAIDITQFPNCQACVDVIYNPIHTKFITDAKQLGIPAVGGLEMLVAQAKYALEHFKDIRIAESEIDRIYQDILEQVTNLVIVGMPGCGKSTIAKEISSLCNKQYIDLDEEIVKQIGMPIADFFEKEGEAKFRQIEKEICSKFSKQSNLVISTGGGIVKDPENINHLRMNGVIVLLKRDFELLASDDSRPLSSTREKLIKLYEERKELYDNAKDIVINNDSNINTVAKQVIDGYRKQLKTY